ncbi:MAG TPA: RidA family protein [Candidatus Limnocylindrales bacterium]|jgi:enamine deaminase RidA (YjgF/YER057c/UK114 family)
MNTARNPETIHAPAGRYVHQIEVSNPSRILFISGQVGTRADGTTPADPVDQLRVAVENVLRNLEAAGLGVDSLTKLTTYAVGTLDPVGRRAVLDEQLGAHVSCSTLVYVAALASPDFKIEVDAWAAV